MVKAIVCGALLVLAVAGCARSQSESVGSVRISGGSNAQRRVLGSIVEGMGPTGIAKLTFGTSRDGQPLLSAEYADEHDAHAEWTSSLAAAAFNEEARRGGARRVEVFRNGVLGSVNPIRGGDGATVPGLDLPALRRELETVVGRQGVAWSICAYSRSLEGRPPPSSSRPTGLPSTRPSGRRSSRQRWPAMVWPAATSRFAMNETQRRSRRTTPTSQA